MLLRSNEDFYATQQSSIWLFFKLKVMVVIVVVVVNFTKGELPDNSNFVAKVDLVAEKVLV
jgi:hypothetical protein